MPHHELLIIRLQSYYIYRQMLLHLSSRLCSLSSSLARIMLYPHSYISKKFFLVPSPILFVINKYFVFWYALLTCAILPTFHMLLVIYCPRLFTVKVAKSSFYVNRYRSIYGMIIFHPIWWHLFGFFFQRQPSLSLTKCLRKKTRICAYDQRYSLLLIFYYIIQKKINRNMIKSVL